MDRPQGAFATDEELDAFVDAASEQEKARGVRMFMNRPDRWFEATKWRCRNGHVSRTFQRASEGPHLDLCLECGCKVRLTFPEDEELLP